MGAGVGFAKLVDEAASGAGNGFAKAAAADWLNRAASWVSVMQVEPTQRRLFAVTVSETNEWAKPATVAARSHLRYQFLHSFTMTAMMERSSMPESAPVASYVPKCGSIVMASSAMKP